MSPYEEEEDREEDEKLLKDNKVLNEFQYIQ